MKHSVLLLHPDVYPLTDNRVSLASATLLDVDLIMIHVSSFKTGTDTLSLPYHGMKEIKYHHFGSENKTLSFGILTSYRFA